MPIGNAGPLSGERPRQIDRKFERFEHGLVHFREAGVTGTTGPLPLYMAHAAPSSSLGLVGLMQKLAERRRVIAVDMPGFGDSDPLASEAPHLQDYIDVTLATLDRLGIERVDLYGSHTGAQIVCEIALARPHQVRRVVLDGVGLFPAELRAELKERYAPPITPDDHGGHLIWAWNFVRDLSLHFPHYRRDPAYRLMASSVPEAAALQPRVLDLLKALGGYHRGYQAAFSHEIGVRLPLLEVQTLVMCAETDPLSVYLDRAALLVPNAAKALVTNTAKADVIERFLDA